MAIDRTKWISTDVEGDQYVNKQFASLEAGVKAQYYPHRSFINQKEIA